MLDILHGVVETIIFEYKPFNHPELHWGELYLCCGLHDSIVFEHESCRNVGTKQFQLKFQLEKKRFVLSKPTSTVSNTIRKKNKLHLTTYSLINLQGLEFGYRIFPLIPQISNLQPGSKELVSTLYTLGAELFFRSYRSSTCLKKSVPLPASLCGFVRFSQGILSFADFSHKTNYQCIDLSHFCSPTTE